MAFAAPRIGAAAVVDRSPAAVLPDEVPLLPFCIMLLSFALVLISHFRRKIESGLIEKKYLQHANCASDCATAGQCPTADKQPCLAHHPITISPITTQCQNQQDGADPEPAQLGWGCLQQQTYSPSLLLVHRELAIRIAQGAPGLSVSEPVTTPNMSLKTAPVIQVAAEQRQGSDSAQISCQEVEQMEPPTRRQKLVVSTSSQDLRIYVNEAQRRYQVYCGQKELKSISWGCQNGAKPWDSWKKVAKLVVETCR